MNIHLPFITKIINVSFENGRFPDELKLAEVTPIFKKNDELDKESYRPVSILSHASKVFERIMYMQIDTFMRDKLSKILTGFSKNHSTQHCLMSLLLNLEKYIGQRRLCFCYFYGPFKGL